MGLFFFMRLWGRQGGILVSLLLFFFYLLFELRCMLKRVEVKLELRLQFYRFYCLQFRIWGNMEIEQWILFLLFFRQLFRNFFWVFGGYSFYFLGGQLLYDFWDQRRRVLEGFEFFCVLVRRVFRAEVREFYFFQFYRRSFFSYVYSQFNRSFYLFTGYLSYSFRDFQEVRRRAVEWVEVLFVRYFLIIFIFFTVLGEVLY